MDCIGVAFLLTCFVCLASGKLDKDYLQVQKAYETHRDFLLNNIHPISEALLYNDGGELVYMDSQQALDRIDWLVSIRELNNTVVNFALVKKSKFFYYRVLDRSFVNTIAVLNSTENVDKEHIVIGYTSKLRMGIKKMLSNLNSDVVHDKPPVEKPKDEKNVDNSRKCGLKEVEINIFMSMSADDYILFPQSAKLNICAGECDWHSVEFDIENNSQLYFLKKMYEFNGNEKMYKKSLCCSPSGKMKSFSIVSLNTETSTVEYHVLKNFSATGCKCT